MRLYLDNLIAYGGHGRVYAARVTSSSGVYAAPVAVKKAHVTKHVAHPALQHEAAALLLLAGHPALPTAYAWGRSQYYEYLATERLGPELGSVLAAPTPLTLRNLVVLACQMLDAVEHVHGHGIVHCDIKPNNFLFTRDGTRLKLIDFGIARRWRDRATGAHIAPSDIPRMVGSAQYASISVHRLHNLARRDDMESLAYTVVKLLRGSLPWRDEPWENILRTKLAWSGAAMCAGYPAVFADFVDSARAMAFDAAPDYGARRRALRALVPAGLPEDALYDAAHSGPPHVGAPGAREAEPRDADVDVDAADVGGAEPGSDGASFNYRSDDHWIPTSSWAPPHFVRPADLFFGSEGDVVARSLEGIEEPPEMEEPYLYGLEGHDTEEVMVPRSGSAGCDPLSA